VKEPHFFATDLRPYSAIKTLEEYLRLFASSTAAHSGPAKLRCTTLRSTAALPNIHEFNPEARIIAMSRNPADMLHALQSQLLYVGIEDVPRSRMPGDCRSGFSCGTGRRIP
jgi:hypothetical protein